MSSNALQTARIVTPQSKTDPADVKVEEIPLPPPELWAELDNSGAKSVAPSADTAAATGALLPRDIATLNFVKPTVVAVTLEFPFTHPSLGLVETIEVRRLTVGEVGDMLSRRPPNAPDMFDIYEAMTKVPAAVLRGLIDVDGEAVTEICFDFLPRLFRPVRRTGNASSST